MKELISLCDFQYITKVVKWLYRIRDKTGEQGLCIYKGKIPEEGKWRRERNCAGHFGGWKLLHWRAGIAGDGGMELS